MKSKFQTALSFIGAPCLGIDFFRHAHSMDQWDPSVLTRVLDILYMAGWISAMFAFVSIRANGEKKSAKIILYIQLLFLILAGSSDVAALCNAVPGNLFFYWDLFWPISNCMMLVTGISIAVAGKLKRWQRWIPLLVGLWLPFTIMAKVWLSPVYAAYLGGTYSIVMWSIMAYVAHNNKRQVTREAHGLQFAWS